MRAARDDMLAGIMFLAFGGAYGGMALRTLPLGGGADMGPGAFPLGLSLAVATLGLIIFVRGLQRTIVGDDCGIALPPPLRAIACVSGGILFFAVCAEGLGMFPAIGGAAFISALAREGRQPLGALIASLAIAGFCTLVFRFGIGLPLPAIGPWLGGA